MAEFVPNRTPRQRPSLLHEGEAFVATPGFLGGFELGRRIEESREDGLPGGAGADDVGSDAIDGGIKEIEGDVDLVPGLAASDFEEEVAHGVVEQDDVIAIPADGAAGVEE